MQFLILKILTRITEEGRNSMRHFVAGLLLVLSIVLLSISIYFLMGMYIQEKQDDALQEQLRDIYENEDGAQELPGWEHIPTGKPASFVVDAGLLALHEENPDCIGWLTVDGTMIDYPVMHHPEEENYYLHRDFDGNYNANGCLFLAENCEPETSDNLIIYGHHMNSGKMFAALEGYKEKKFCEEHSLIIYNTLHGKETYQVLAAFATPVYTGNDFAYYAFIKAESKRDYDSFIEAVKKRSLYDTGVTAVYGEKLLTLSTCEYSQKNGRMVVVAKKIETE